MPTPKTTIQYAPAGEHFVFASNQPMGIYVRVGADAVEALQAQLVGLLSAAGAGIRSMPYIDLNHDCGAAMAHPVAFRWDAADGILLDLEWTDAGREAVESGAWSYFSPTMVVGEGGAILGFAEPGPIGALVNTPAFQTIQRVAASHAQILMHEQSTQAATTEPTAAEATEAPVVDTPTVESVAAEQPAAQDPSEMDTLRAENERLRAELAAINEQRIAAAAASEGLPEAAVQVVVASYRTGGETAAQAAVAAFRAVQSAAAPKSAAPLRVSASAEPGAGLTHSEKYAAIKEPTAALAYFRAHSEDILNGR